MSRQSRSLSAFDVVTSPYPEGIPIWGDNDPTAQIDAREMNVTAEASMFVDTGLIDWPEPARQVAVQERIRPQARRFPPPVPLRRTAVLDRELAARRAVPPPAAVEIERIAVVPGRPHGSPTSFAPPVPRRPNIADRPHCRLPPPIPPDARRLSGSNRPGDS